MDSMSKIKLACLQRLFLHFKVVQISRRTANERAADGGEESVIWPLTLATVIAA